MLLVVLCYMVAETRNYPWPWPRVRIHQLYLCRGVPPPNECPVYDTKQSDDKAPVMLELWRMQNTPLLPSLPGPLWLKVVSPDRVLSMGQIEINCVLMINWIVWNMIVFDIETVYLCKTELFEIEVFIYIKMIWH